MPDNIQDILSKLSPEERDATMKILNEMGQEGYSNTLNRLYEDDYDEIPVDIDRFIEDPEYAGNFTGNGSLIYPYWRDRLREIFHTPGRNYSEIALTGSIGIGKSTIAVLGLAYCMYCLMCLKDPQAYYRLAKGSTIVVAFFNNTLDLSNSVGYQTLQSLVKDSPWFMKRGKLSGIKNVEYIPDKLIRFRVGSQASHALGTNIFCGMIDEISFAPGANVQMEKSKIMETYNGVFERMSSRFMVNGEIAGKLFVVSSKKSEHSFLENYIKKKKNDPHVFVADAPLWEVKPSQTYSNNKFQLAVGGSNLPSKIVPDEESVVTIELNNSEVSDLKFNDDVQLSNKVTKKAYDLIVGDTLSNGTTVTNIEYGSEKYIHMGYDVINVPVEFKGRFELDLQAAIMNIAGISISDVLKFIPYDSVAQNYCSDVSPFRFEVIELGTKDKLMISDFFDPSVVSPIVYSKPIFIHLDASVTGDKTGLSAVAVMGYVYQNDYDVEQGIVMPTKRLAYKQIFSVGIQAPPNAEISFQKTRDFIYYLRNQLGWNIKGVSTDGFQSVDTRQQLQSMGFDAKLVSLDRTPDGYTVFKAALAEKRISLIENKYLETEIIQLERDNMTGKVDHPISGCFTYDTKIVMLDPKNWRHDIEIGELATNYEKYHDYRIVGIDSSGNSIITGYKNPRETKRVSELIEIELDNGEIIECTPDHLFLCNMNGTYDYVKAKDLTEESDIVTPFDNLDSSIKYMKNLGFSSRKILDLVGDKIISQYIDGMSLSQLSKRYNLSQTVLNWYIGSHGYKRTKSEAFKSAKDNGKLCGSITRRLYDKDFDNMMREKARYNLTEYNKTEESRLKRHARIIKDSTRKKLRDNGIKRWQDPEYVMKISKSNAGNIGYGKHQIYVSERFNKTFKLKSETEKLFVEWFERIPECTNIFYESISLKYSDGDRDRVYLPDFILEIDGTSTIMIEAKYDRRKIYRPDYGDNKYKYEAGIEYCLNHNMKFLWLYKSDIGKAGLL